MSDYYEPYPRILLSRSIVVAGQLGCGARLVGRAVCARTGVRYVDVDRRIEHEEGRALHRIAYEEGPPYIAAAASRILARIVDERPWAVVVLDRAWPEPGGEASLLADLDVAHLKRDPAFLIAHVVADLRSAHGWVAPELEPEALGTSALLRLHAKRDPLLRESDIVVEAGSLHAHAVATILIEALESVAGAEPMPSA